MIAKPAYFETIRQSAATRWDQLESDPDLAAPWHQLFKQIQSPRHILSELLQNADDVGATEATARVENDRFVFSHNGTDFTETEFTSLCRFGYSNKRALHTIGFRGIGFKSTFSIGDVVYLSTPTLSVAFEKRRFTEPKWITGREGVPRRTEIRVPIGDARRKKEVEKNFQEWLKSPISLLFFRNIRRLQIGDRAMHWGSLGPGPVKQTEWMALHDQPDDAYLLAVSGAELFPADALDEIRQERMLDSGQKADFPPCKVEIVLGTPGRLYVVLPTGIETALPFACNAPFIQDPGRLKIKDPETSPTNRWLLARAGGLAASVMVKWLRNERLSIAERARAYGLLPDVDRENSSLEGGCATAVEEPFDEMFEKESMILTGDGELTKSGQVVVYPKELLEVWSAEQIGQFFDEENRPALSLDVDEADRQKLIDWGAVGQVNKDEVFTVLQSKHLPKPETWRKLLNLWAYIAPEITAWQMHSARSKLRIVPVQGKNVLYSASEVVRLGEKRLLQSNEDWEFLSAHLLVMNSNWPRFLAEQRRKSGETGDGEPSDLFHAAESVLTALRLVESANVSKVVEQVSAEFFTQDELDISDCVRLAQIAASLGATTGEHFQFVTRDCHLKSRKDAIVCDDDGSVESLLPGSYAEQHILHSDYSQSFGSCTREEWRRWISSGQSGLLEAPPIKQATFYAHERKKIEAELGTRGSLVKPSYPYVTSSFVIEDWDFEETLWQFWKYLSKADAAVWVHLLDRVFSQNASCWTSAASVRVLQIATTGNRSLVADNLLPKWILRLRELPCLRDTRGAPRKPAEMLRRTPQTEALLDVEPFVDARIDREATRPLLRLLGVRDVPTGADRILDCLRSLAQSTQAPSAEVDKWYRRLDQMIDGCSTADLLNVKGAFRDEKLVLAQDGDWCTASGVYLSADDDDVPGAAIIRPSVSELALWRKLGLAEHPTADLAIGWLQELPADTVLSSDDMRRVRALLGRHAKRIWHECGYWLNLAGEWSAVGTLKYSVTMQTLTAYAHLHDWVKKQTADFQRLPVEIGDAPPFSDLPRLAGRIEERLDRKTLREGVAETHPWLTQFGIELRRIEIADENETERIRRLGDDLAHTTWRTAPGLEVTPYLDGTPAGVPTAAGVVWTNRTLYVEKLPKAKLARLVPERFAKVFGRAEIAAALSYCFSRSRDDVTEYFESNFKLALQPAEGAEAVIAPVAALVVPATAPEPDTIDHLAPGEPAVAADLPENASFADENELLAEDAAANGARPIKLRPTKPAKPSVMERFAASQGFQRDGEARFFHADGSWIERVRGEPFPWQRRRIDGQTVRFYLPEEHCLDTGPLQIRAEAWSLIKVFPNTYSLVLVDSLDVPVEITGADLCAMIDKRDLVLFPAAYRLVRESRSERPAA